MGTRRNDVFPGQSLARYHAPRTGSPILMTDHASENITRLTPHNSDHIERRSLYWRALDALPGALAGLCTSVIVILSVRTPHLALDLAALLAGYTAVRFVLAGISYTQGLRLIRRCEKDGLAAPALIEANSSTGITYDGVHHLVILPSFGDGPDVVRRSLDALAAYARARSTMTVVLALEAADPSASETGATLQAEYRTAFANLLVTHHPPGLPSEIPCKGANLTWGARHAQRFLVDDNCINRDTIVVTVMDADTRWHPRYFEKLTACFVSDSQRYHTYWQAPMRYTGNVWKAPAWLRALHAQASAWELAYLAAPWWMALPMSSYSASLRLLEDSGYWDPAAIADEWHMAITSFFEQNGQQRIQPIYVPFLAQTVTAPTVRQTLSARYRQTLRHAWGAQEIGCTLDQMRRHVSTPVTRSARLLLRVAHDNLMAGAGWLVIVLGSQLPFLLHPAWALTQWHSGIFWLIQASAAIIAATALFFWIADLRTRPPRPDPWTRREMIGELLGVMLLGVLTAVCVGLPVLHAQYRLLAGKSLEFRVTAKQ